MGNVMINGFKVCPIFQANHAGTAGTQAKYVKKPVDLARIVGSVIDTNTISLRAKWRCDRLEIPKKPWNFLVKQLGPPLKRVGWFSVANLTQLCAIVYAGWGFYYWDTMILTPHTRGDKHLNIASKLNHAHGKWVPSVWFLLIVYIQYSVVNPMKPTIWRWWLPPIYGDILRMGLLLGLPHYKNFTNGTIFGPGERGPVLWQILWAGHYEKALFRLDWKTICRRCHVKKRSEEMAFPISRMQEHRAIFPDDVLYICC